MFGKKVFFEKVDCLLSSSSSSSSSSNHNIIGRGGQHTDEVPLYLDDVVVESVIETDTEYAGGTDVADPGSAGHNYRQCISRYDMRSNTIYLLDAGLQVFVWVGDSVSPLDGQVSTIKAQQYLDRGNDSSGPPLPPGVARAPWTPIIR